MERRKQIQPQGNIWTLGVRASSYSFGYETVFSIDEASSREKVLGTGGGLGKKIPGKASVIRC